MDEEIKRTMEELADGMRQLTESFGNQFKQVNEQVDKDKKIASWKEEDHKRQQANSKDVREAEIKKLGYYRDEFGIIKESIDIRKAESYQRKEAVAQIKRDVGEEAYARKQQQRMLSEASTIMKGHTTEHGRQLDSLSSIIGAGKDSLYDMAKGSAKASIGMVALDSVATLTAAALTGVAKASMAMGKALLNGERGMSVSAKGVTEFTHSLTDGMRTVGKGLIGLAVVLAPFTGGLSLAAVALTGFAGVALTAAASAADMLAELNDISAQLNDKLFAGFNELGKMSMTAAGGMEDVRDKLHGMGLTINEFDKFKTIVAANSKEMKMFGTTMADGLTKFTNLSTDLYHSESSKMFERMGITLDEQYDHAAKYMALQARLGTLQEKNAKDLEKGTKAYIEELDKIATLTGATRKEQETAREAVMKIEQLRAALLDEQRKKEAGDTGADARIAKLQRGLDMATTAQQMGDTSTAKGAAEYSAAGGVISEDSAKFALMIQRQGLEGMLSKGGVSKEAMDLAFRRAYIEQTQSVSSAMRIGANVGPLGGSAVVAGDQKAILAEFTKREAEEKKKLGTEYNQQEFLNRLTKEREAKTGAVPENVDMQRKNKESAITLDTAASKFASAVGVNKLANDAFAASVEKFDKYLNGKGSSGVNSAAIRSSGNITSAEPTYGTTGAGAAFGNPNITRQGQRKGATQAAPSSTQSLQDAGLILKKGDVQQSGAGVDPRLIDLAKQVQNIPGFKYFSAFNDGFHNEKSPSSSHTTGRAFDFVLDKKPSKEEGQKLTAMLQGMGLDYVQDEYNNPSSKATAGHIHAELKGARTGGVFEGPSSGYPVMLHGREAVVPQANFKDIKKETLSSGTSNTSNGPDEVVGLLADMVETMSDKLDQVINKLGDSNDIQGKILNYSMA